MNHFAPAYIINNLVPLVVKLSMNELDPKNVIIYKFLKKQRPGVLFYLTLLISELIYLNDQVIKTSKLL